MIELKLFSSQSKILDENKVYWPGRKYIGWEQNILAHKKNNIGSERKKNIIYFCMFKKLSWLCWTDEPFVIDRFLSASYHINWIIVSKLKKCEGHESRYNLSVLAAFSNSFSLEGFNGNLVQIFTFSDLESETALSISVQLAFKRNAAEKCINMEEHWEKLTCSLV